jgi:OOP family OmpA-OmpF porin
MNRRHLLSCVAASSIALLAACGSAPTYTPASVQPAVIDTDGYAPKVDSFVVILDTSSSMGEDYMDRPKLHTAQDVVASFNSTVPALGYDAGMVTFGTGSGRCFSGGMAKAVYGLTPYQAGDFSNALNAVTCAGGTTPMSEGIDAAAEMLSSETGSIAVILVSDFKWVSAGPVSGAVSKLKAQHANNLCLHTVKVGDNTTGDALIAAIADNAGCDSSVNAGDIASADAMAAFVTGALLAPLQYEKHSVAATALFDFDKAVLKDQGKAELQKLGEYIKGHGIKVGDIDVVGHTDSIGPADYNQGLSERRAMAVSEYMVSQGVDGSIIDVSGKGETEPVASNDTSEGQALNRRVDIHVGVSRPAGS